MMTMRRFRALLASYGAAEHLWPANERAAARALLATSHQARTLAEAERALDAALAASAQHAAFVPTPGETEGAALARLRSSVAARIVPLGTTRKAPSRPHGALRLAGPSMVLSGRRLTLGALAGASVIAGLSLGVLVPAAAPVHPAPGISALLQASPIAGLP